ncbi:mannose-6-phosphate isomerase [Copidosoma floridanum]|uniref:mannose-6-phosphate isomerase n=1 Tax=Copidosoma floridanum TaxID=29053 RepID=UPI0006C97043|nr:mannose-6-phosphate isomerase [Copidosoma floridanum]XP_023248236.1 mannose-6-phosphate isomerase [Copidosoma floridanum]
MELNCSIQNYEWGRKGSDSIIANLMKSSNPDFIINESLPYAELWMGTHPNGPSLLKGKNIFLEEYVRDNNHVLGKVLIDKYNGKIPFLLKVESVRKALSIQVHPSKEQAEMLHQSSPNIYKDDNHKPELAVALSKFETLCGFRPISEIKNYLRSIPELCFVIGHNEISHMFSSSESNFLDILKNCFINLMSQETEIVAEQLKKLIKRLSDLDETTRQSLKADLLERLYSDYPDDVGCFCIYLFNHVTLQPGEAMYIAANEPHAYLSGDCIECMSCSDNVVRAGLTPKLKDVETLISILSYTCEPASAKLFKPIKEDECTQIFKPPVQDFAVAKIVIPPRKSYDLIPRSTASIMIVISGNIEISDSQIFNKGSALFLSAEESISIKTTSCSEPVMIFQAFANV